MAAPQMPTESVTLTVEQIGELNRKLSDMRHDINSNLSVISLGAEVVKLNPAKAQEMLSKLAEQPLKITEHIKRFSSEFERTFGIRRG
ncbi:MAG: hypothetical protein C5B50_02925 [Verrucomicrobia bacterium]|nr:MAG: hypothetical protein C5B50_02925 [Verrucomicrobiota bacterium]